MATARLYNLARMDTATTGTGTVTLGSAVTGFLSFANAGVADGATVTYAIRDGNNSEIGRGVYTSSGTTLSRATILNSTNSNNALNLSGSAEVFLTPSAQDFYPTTNAQTGTTYTVLATDVGKLVTLSNAASIAVTLPQATGLFTTGFWFYIQNIGVGTVTITPTTSTLNGKASLVLYSGQGAMIVSDGTNYSATTNAPQNWTSFRNVIINGAMNVWQRSLSGTTSGQMYADRWTFSATGTGPFSFARSNSNPGDFAYSALLTSTSQTSSEYLRLTQRVEAAQSKPLAGATITVSFYLAATEAGTVDLDFGYPSAVDNWASHEFISTSTVAVATGWTRYTIQKTLVASASAYTAANGLEIHLSYKRTTTGAGEVRFVGIQVEQGNIATPFEFLSVATDLNNCMRFYERSNLQAALSYNGSIIFRAVANHIQPVQFLVPKRTIPTVTLFDPATGAAQWRDVSIDGAQAATVSNVNEYRATVSLTTPTAGNSIAGHYIASAEL